MSASITSTASTRPAGKADSVSRRQLLGGMGIGLAGALAAAGIASPALAVASSDGSVAYSDTIAWNAEYDAVIVGFGFAGSAAAISAADNGAGKVLLLEKAPYGDEGGNSRYAEQYVLTWNSAEDGKKYFGIMNEGFADATEDIIDFVAKGGAENMDWLASIGAEDMQVVMDSSRSFAREDLVKTFSEEMVTDLEVGEYVVQREDGTYSYEEYPILPNGEWCNGLCHWRQLGGADKGNKRLWKAVRQAVLDRSDVIDIWLESPAVALIQDPFSKTILGVQVQRNGETVNVRARNGVALTCGSIESSPELMQTYAQREVFYPFGTTYNTGDGLKMAEAAGADIWHTAALSGPWTMPKYPDVDRCYWTGAMARRYTTGYACIHVDGRGKRYFPECGWHHHGHVRMGDTWQNQIVPRVMWAIFDSTADTRGYTKKIDPSVLISADTIEELAGQIELDPTVVAQTVADYNGFCEQGADLEFGRDPRTLQAIAQAPFYAVRLYPCGVNAQAGARRNAKCEVVDPSGTPIPNLYSAGEGGSFWAGVYECGGNVSEALYTGRAVGEALSQPKEEPQAVTLTAVESDPSLSGNDVLDIEGAGTDVELGDGEYLGTGEGLHGAIQVKVAYADGTISAIEVVSQHETAGLTDRVWSEMPAAMVEANSAEVDTVAGATVSSNGLIAAVQDAIAQA